MSHGRIVLAAMTAWIAPVAPGSLINDVWLVHLYAANAWAFRYREDISRLLPIGLGAQLIACVAF